MFGERMSQLEIWLVSSPFLSSWVHLEVLASTWRFGTSYSSPVKFTEASVIEEDSGSFLGFDTSWNELATCQLSLSAGSQCWLWHSVQTASGATELILNWLVFEQFLVENFCELLWFVSLVPLGVGTTCLGTLDPLDYWHFMLHAVRHKNFYNTYNTR